MASRNRGPECAAVIGLFLGLAWVFFSMRMYVRTFLTKGWGVDDLLLIVAVVLFTSFSIFDALGVHYGTGRHPSDIPLQDIPKALYFRFLCELLYTLSTVFIRLSIATFLIRICFERVYKIIIYTTIVMITGFSIFYFFLVLFQCSPVSFFWNQYKGEKGSCMNPATVPNASIAHSVISFTADWVLGLLPIAIIWNLQMNRCTKICLGCILALGLLAGVATMIRIPYIKVFSITDDFLYSTTDVAIWSIVEAGLGIVAASAITLRPLLRSLYSSSSRSTPGYPTARATSGARYKMNICRPTCTTGSEVYNSQLGIPFRQDPMSANENANAHVNWNGNGVSVVASTCSPFGDLNEDISQELHRESESDGEIQAHHTFEMRSGGEEAQGAWYTRWQTLDPSRSSVSIV